METCDSETRMENSDFFPREPVTKLFEVAPGCGGTLGIVQRVCKWIRADLVAVWMCCILAFVAPGPRVYRQSRTLCQLNGRGCRISYSLTQLHSSYYISTVLLIRGMSSRGVRVGFLGFGRRRKSRRWEEVNAVDSIVQFDSQTVGVDFVTVKSIKMRLRKSRTCVHTYITSKRTELESPC